MEKLNDQQLKERLSLLSKKQLAERLSKYGLPTNGNIDELIKRLMRAMKTINYSKFSVAQLRDQLRVRKLSTEGSASVLILRLVNDDYRQIMERAKAATLSGVPDADLIIMENLDGKSLAALCTADSYTAKLCRNEGLWARRIIKQYGVDLSTSLRPGDSLKEVYWDLHNITGDLTVRDWDRKTRTELTIYTIRKGFLHLFERCFSLWIDYHNQEIKEEQEEPAVVERNVYADLASFVINAMLWQQVTILDQLVHFSEEEDILVFQDPEVRDEHIIHIAVARSQTTDMIDILWEVFGGYILYQCYNRSAVVEHLVEKGVDFSGLVDLWIGGFEQDFLRGDISLPEMQIRVDCINILIVAGYPVSDTKRYRDLQRSINVFDIYLADLGDKV